jgi:hypothetical protein
MFVGARHDESVHLRAFQFGAKGGKPGFALPRIALHIEGLEATLEHRLTVEAVFRPSNTAPVPLVSRVTHLCDASVMEI